MKALKIIFMGTPEFAVPTLDTLHKSRHEIVAVVTSTDKYGGRGNKKLLESAVKKYGLEHNIPVLQPKNLKSKNFGEELASFNADIQVVVAFRMLPVVVWDMPEYGTINLHGSLLPMYRGAAPINWAIIQGEKVTGLTTFKLKHEIDTGNIIQQVKLKIEDQDTVGIVHDKLMQLGGPLMLETLDTIADGSVSYLEQDQSLVTKAPKIFSETCQIDFNKTSQKVHNLIRGLSPRPGAWTNFEDGSRLKIFLSEICLEAHLKPGEIESDNKSYLKVGTSDKSIKVLEAQLPGKRRMKISEILNGYKFKDESSFQLVNPS